MQKPIRIYISGKITGLNIKQAEALFEYVEGQLAQAGHEPVNPMKLLPFDEKYTWLDYMVEDIRGLLTCDAILMLPNWTDSKGAKVEHAIAVSMGMMCYYSQNHDLFSPVALPAVSADQEVGQAA
jgi:hypothetical protein